MLMSLIDIIKISEMFFCVFMSVENQYQMEISQKFTHNSVYSNL